MYEIAVVSLGIAIGVFFFESLKSLLPFFITLFLFFGTYVIIVLTKQIEYE